MVLPYKIRFEIGKVEAGILAIIFIGFAGAYLMDRSISRLAFVLVIIAGVIVVVIIAMYIFYTPPMEQEFTETYTRLIEKELRLMREPYDFMRDSLVSEWEEAYFLAAEMENYEFAEFAKNKIVELREMDLTAPAK